MENPRFREVTKLEEYDLLKECFKIDTHYRSEDTSDLQTVTLLNLPKVKGDLIPIELHNSQGVLSLLVISFFLMIFSLQRGREYFKENLSLLFTDSRLDKQETFKELATSAILYAISLLMLSIVVYERLEVWEIAQDFPFIKIIIFWGCLLLFSYTKYLGYRLYAYIFDIQKDMRHWRKLSVTFTNMFGVISFIPIMILVFSNIWHDIIINFLIICFLLVQLFLVLRLMLFFITKKYDYLYLFVYLCAIEIIPFVCLGILLVNLYKVNII